MHDHCEIVMPPTDDIAAAVEAILAPFNENGKDDDGEYNRHAFWDWYVIGGRWSGAKMTHRLGKDRMDAFYAWAREAEVKVSGVQFGKQSIATAEMEALVDAKWREMFPGTVDRCPLFQHAGDTLPGDVCTVADIAPDFTCDRVIIAGPRHNDKPGASVDDVASWCGPLEARFMLVEDAWNGVNHMPVQWDQTVASALMQADEKFKNYRKAFREANTPTANWLVVTVDYHS